MNRWDRYRRIMIQKDGFVTFPFLSTNIPDFQEHFLWTFTNNTNILRKHITKQSEIILQKKWLGKLI